MKLTDVLTLPPCVISQHLGCLPNLTGCLHITLCTTGSPILHRVIAMEVCNIMAANAARGVPLALYVYVTVNVLSAAWYI